MRRIVRPERASGAEWCVGLVLICGVLSACSTADTDQPASDGESVLNQFFESPEDLAGEVIELQGFLDVRLGSLAIYRDELSASKARFEYKPIVIRDTSPSKELRLESRYLERTCTGSYVRLLGKVGYLEEHQFFGIAEISEIWVFPSDRFLGEGELCYSSQDPTIYSPREIQDEKSSVDVVENTDREPES